MRERPQRIRKHRPNEVTAAVKRSKEKAPKDYLTVEDLELVVETMNRDACEEAVAEESDNDDEVL